MDWRPGEFDEEGLRSFLWLVEEELAERARRRDADFRTCRAVLIGGGAIVLGYGVRRGTTDIDIWQSSEALEDAWKEAARKAGGDTPVLHVVNVADPPFNFEDRLQPVELKRAGAGGEEETTRILRPFVPERHDLAMMKIVRGSERDVEALAALHAAHPLDPSILETLYRTEMSQIVCDMRRFRLQFLDVVETLFGAKAAKVIEKRLPVLGAPRD